MVKVPMGVDHKQGELRGSVCGQQVHHSLRQRHLIRICHVAGVDEKRLRRSNEEVHERRFERGTKVLSKDECLRVVGVYLNGRLRTGLAVHCTFVPVNVHGPGHELRLGRRGCEERRKSQQSDEHGSDEDHLVNDN